MNALETFIYEFTTVSPFEAVSTIVFFSIVVINAMYKINKAIKVDPKIVNIEVIDNHAQWVYDNKIYYADVVNGRIDNSTMRRIEI